MAVEMIVQIVCDISFDFQLALSATLLIAILSTGFERFSGRQRLLDFNDRLRVTCRDGPDGNLEHVEVRRQGKADEKTSCTTSSTQTCTGTNYCPH